MIPSAASTISSPLAAACGFSILAISGTSAPRSWRCSRTGSRSSRRRTNESAKKSRPISSPASISAMSSALTAGSETVTFGRLSPWREATLPPTSTLVDDVAVGDLVHPQPHGAVGQVADVARARRARRSPARPPAAARRCPRPRRRSARRGSRAPARPRRRPTGPMRSLGPGRSPRMATSRPIALGDARGGGPPSRRAARACRARSSAAPRPCRRRSWPLEHVGVARGRADGGDDLRGAHGRPGTYEQRPAHEKPALSERVARLSG